MSVRHCVHLLFLAVTMLPLYDAAAQSASVSGRVTDAVENFPLPQANVTLLNPDSEELIYGTASDESGAFLLSNVEAGVYVLEVRFVGYRTERIGLDLEAGASRTINIALTPGGLDLNAVVITASRQAEKILDAPASISVLEARDIEREAIHSPVSVLRTTTGVDMAQTGIDRYEVVLRGFNNAFSGATYVLTDYRQGAIASLGVNAYQMMPITQIDLERVEVVRGPGSALYGAGVDAGVVHFITKDPFDHPGTTVSVGGGERGLFLGSLRHAGVVNDRLGYKVVGNYSRADEWEFDCALTMDPDDIPPNAEPQDYLRCGNEHDFVQVGGFRREALPIDYENYRANVNGLLSYRLRPNVTLTANGGFATSKSLFLSGIGTLQSDGFGYTFGQLRLQAGDFFAQAYVNRNDAGNSFVYRDTAVEEVIDRSILLNIQAQQNFSRADDRLRLIVGADYRLTSPETEESITGRNENDDQILEIGAYGQGSYALSPQFDLTLAMRGDYNNVVEEFQLSPRAALVFKPSTTHSFRATYNRAFSSPGTNSFFLDINAGSAGPLTIQARGSAHGFTFERDPQFGGLVASSIIPQRFGRPMPKGMPLGFVYGLLYNRIAEIPTSELQAILAQNGINLTEEQVSGLVTLLGPQAGTNVGGFAESELGFLNLTTLTIDQRADDVVDIEPLQQTTSQTFEIGYKGLFGGRAVITADLYYVNKRNFIGPLLVESPFVLAPAPASVLSELQPAIVGGIEGNAQLMAQLEALQIPAQMVAALLMGLASDELAAGLPAAGTPIGIVQPVENAIPGQLLLSYRNFGTIDYVGVDLGTEIMASDRLRLFGNLSWISDNFFDDEELDEEGTSLELSANAPKIKVKGGFDYEVPRGPRFNAAVRHTGSFTVRSGPYEGEVEAYTLVDVGAGYDLSRFANGLRADVTVLNLLNNEHREFIGAPELGRLAILRLTYNL